MEFTSEPLILLICAVATLLLYLPGLTYGLNLADEGYLWYGALRTAADAIPVRDFRAYDPGRYYWCAWWMQLLGPSLLSLRIALLLVQLIAVLATTYTITLATESWWAALLGGVTAAMWMQPRHKQFDILFASLGLLCAVLLVTHPSPQQLFLSGIFVGSCFLFGLNHALYNGAGLLLLSVLMAWNNIFTDLSIILWYPLGLAAVLLPTGILILLTPGLAASYWQHKVLRILKRGSANLALPVPWPWRKHPHQLQKLPAIARGMMSVGTLLPPILYLLVIAVTLLGITPLEKSLWPAVAVSCIGLFYLHHYLSRADLSHLAQSITPIITLITILASQHEAGWILLIPFTILSAHAIYMQLEPRVVMRRHNTLTQRLEINTSTYTVPAVMGKYLAHVQGLLDNYSEQGDSIFIAPIEVSLYPLFDRKPAVYDTFPVYPASEQEQSEMIRQLDTNDTKLALIHDYKLDMRDELRFKNTHPLVWLHLEQNFIHLKDHALSESGRDLFVPRIPPKGRYR